jgi:uncharacterized protein (DUF169 family)
MPTWEERSTSLDRLLKLETMPLGIRLIEDERECPPKVKRPNDFKKKMALCQLITMARRLGWTIAAFPEEMACFFPVVALGWRQVDRKEDMTNFFVEAKYCANRVVAQRRTEDFLKSRPKIGTGIIYSPLSKMSIKPEVVLIYGNPAQVMRLIRGYVNFTGLPIQSNFLGGLSCAESLITCRQSHQAQVAVPGNGERIFGMTHDHEMSFYVPADQIDDLITGLRSEHDIGTSRYPIPVYQLFTPQFPKIYVDFLEKSLVEE